MRQVAVALCGWRGGREGCVHWSTFRPSEMDALKRGAGGAPGAISSRLNACSFSSSAPLCDHSALDKSYDINRGSMNNERAHVTYKNLHNRLLKTRVLLVEQGLCSYEIGDRIIDTN